MRYRYNTQCGECGRFCKPADRGTHFGSYADEEPPEPITFCQDCVDKKIANPFDVIIGCWWIRPGYIAVVKSILRHERKHAF